MSSLLQSLSIGSSGLAAAQTALSVVGQNVTNANTEGYSRKSVITRADGIISQQFGQMGNGVNVVAVERARDALLDKQLQQNLSETGRRETLDQSLEKVENIFTEPTDMGLNQAMDKFWNSWQDLANNPSDSTARQAVIDAGKALSGQMQAMGQNFSNLRVEKNQEIVQRVDRVNSILKEIHEANQAISSAEVQNGQTNANDLRDTRETKIRELASIIDIDYVEDQRGRYIVTSGGHMLVPPEAVVGLATDLSTFQMPDGTSQTQASVRLANSQVPFEPASGELAGLFQARDDVLPRYQGKLDDLARKVAQSVNDLHRQGFDLMGSTGTDFFDPGITGASNFRLSANVERGPIYVAAATGGTSVAPGAPLPTTVPAAGAYIDLPTLGLNEYRNLVQGTVEIKTVGPPSLALKEGPGQDFVVDHTNGRIWFNNYPTLAAGTAITVNFRYQKTGFAGVSDGSNALKIAQIRQAKLAQPDSLGQNTASFGDVYSSMVGQLGAERKTSMTGLETIQKLQDYYKQQVQQNSGVSMDEELADMVKFQHSYQASARFIKTIDDLMNSLLNL